MALSDNLVAYWSLEEASGTRDDAHSTHNLTDNATVTQATGKVGNAAQFTAANSEYLSEADTAGLSGSDRDFMILAWLYLDTTGVAHSIATKGISSSAAQGEYRFGVTNANRLFGNVSNGTTQTTATDSVFGALTTGTWYFCEFWHDSVNNVVGIRVNRHATGNTAAHTVGVQDTASEFRLGRQQGAGTSYLNGRLDEVGFWDRILTSTELDDLYNSGNGRDYAYITGGASYTLAAAAGTFTETGVAAALTAQRRLTASAGSYALTGVATSLTLARKLTAAAAAFTHTGQAATLRAARSLTAGAGTFALTGIAATFRRALRLATEVRTYTLTGIAAVLDYSNAPEAATPLTRMEYVPARDYLVAVNPQDRGYFVPGDVRRVSIGALED